MRALDEGGMATAEFAVAMPAVLLVLGLCLGAVSLGVDSVRCLGAAGVAARSVARGDPPAVAVAAARRAGPSGATVSVSTDASDVRVVVRAPRGWLNRVLGLSVVPSGTAVAVREDEAEPAGPPP